MIITIIKRHLLTLSSKSFKWTGYDHWLVSGLSKRFVDLRQVIVGFNIYTFIIFFHTYLIQRAEHLLLYSFQDSRWGSLLLRVLKRLFLSPARNGQRKRKISVYYISESQPYMGFMVSLKLCWNLSSFNWLKSRQSLFKSLMPIVLSMIIESRALIGFFKPNYLSSGFS